MNLSGLKVQCPNCKRVSFLTTDKYDPLVRANGSMVKQIKSAVPWIIDWLCTSGTLAAEMICPVCGIGALAPSGYLHVLVPIRDVGTVYKELFPNDIIDAELTIGIEAIASVQAIPAKEIPPAETPDNIAAPDPLACPVCGKVCKNEFGLKGHMRSHKEK
jgi:hypothetical protein